MLQPTSYRYDWTIHPECCLCCGSVRACEETIISTMTQQAGNVRANTLGSHVHGCLRGGAPPRLAPLPKPRPLRDPIHTTVYIYPSISKIANQKFERKPLAPTTQETTMIMQFERYIKNIVRLSVVVAECFA